MLLEDALQMVTLHGEAGDPKYEAACRRYLARWIVEESPPLADIAATACHFVERGQEDTEKFQVRTVLEAGLFATYARSFNSSRGQPGLPPAPTSGLTPAQRETHEWAVRERDKSAAHIDRDGNRRMVDGIDEPGGPSWHEMWSPPSRRQLLALADLAALQRS